MKSEEFYYKLIARYLAEECTPEEQTKIEDWIAENPANEKKFKEFKRIWNLSGNRSIRDGRFDASRDWKRLTNILANTEDSFAKTSNRQFYEKKPSSSIHSTTQQLIRVAAIFLIAGFLGFFTYQNLYEAESENNEPVLREISTNKGQRANLTLGDGTKVMLNAESKMRLPTEFAPDVREVYLDGEAYFEVDENPGKPFLVHSNQAEIRVLGTSFNVRSYPQEQKVQVVVEEGKVSLSNTGNEDGGQTVLEQNELGEFDIYSNQLTTRQVEDMELYMSWREGYLKFREAPMTEVAQSLERRYDVEIEFEDEAIKELVLTAYLKSRSLQNVLEVIATSLEIDYQLDKSKVTFLK